MTLPPISRSKLEDLTDKMADRGVSYRLGAKAPSLLCDSSMIQHIDCSGFVRYAACKASGGKILMPDGSYYQHDWCKQQGLVKCSYADAGRQANPNKLFIAFISPEDGSGGIGHVWFLLAGVTLESHGGKGVDSRPWNVAIEGGSTTLSRACSACYLLPSIV